MKNNTDPLVTIIMAAGMGKRMRSDLPKVLQPLAGSPLVHYVIKLTQDLGSTQIVLVVGHGREQVIDQTKAYGVNWVVQEQQLGTGDAIMACHKTLHDYDGDVLILSGDVPLLRSKSVSEALEVHKTTNASATVFTFNPDNPFGYGRIIRGGEGEVLRIVEHKDASNEEKLVNEVNGGIYVFRSKPLFEALGQISSDNQAGEYYLPDTLEIIRKMGLRISAYIVKDPIEMAGVNNVDQLRELEIYYLANRADS